MPLEITSIKPLVLIALLWFLTGWENDVFFFFGFTNSLEFAYDINPFELCRGIPTRSLAFFTHQKLGKIHCWLVGIPHTSNQANKVFGYWYSLWNHICVHHLNNIGYAMGNISLLYFIGKMLFSKIGFANELLCKSDRFVDSLKFKQFILIKYTRGHHPSKNLVMNLIQPKFLVYDFTQIQINLTNWSWICLFPSIGPMELDKKKSDVK